MTKYKITIPKTLSTFQKTEQKTELEYSALSRNSWFNSQKVKLPYILDSGLVKAKYFKAFRFTFGEYVLQLIKIKNLILQYILWYIYCINVSCNRGDQPVALLKLYWSLGCFDISLQLICIFLRAWCLPLCSRQYPIENSVRQVDRVMTDQQNS